MSEKQNRGIGDMSKYDAMTTEELEEILRLDAQTLEEQESDTDKILCIMEVLAQRKRNSENPGKTAQQAWESFEENYFPLEEENLICVAQTERLAKPSRYWLRRMIAVAAVLVILVGIPLTASAFGWGDIWTAVAKWAKETFSFVVNDTPEDTEPATDDAQQYTSLQEVLAETDQATDFVPTWIPDGYILKDITVDENPMQKVYIAMYRNADAFIMITVESYMEFDPEKVEVNDDILEVYEASGAEYYIFSNNQQLSAAWIKDSYECYISGNMTIEEIKMMIDSIGKG